MSRIRFTSLLLCSTAIISTPVMADASLDELKAKLEALDKRTSLLEAENKSLRDALNKNKTVQARTSSVSETSNTKYPTLLNSAAVSETRSSPNPTDYNIIKPIFTATNWSGIYVGINAGYGGNSIETSSSTYAPIQGLSQAFVGTAIIGVGGPLAGGQIGYNHQFSNNVVLGAETVLDYADINNFNGARHASTSNAIILNSSQQYGAGTNYDRLGLNWLGTTRIRLGYAIGNFLPYISGGIAYGQLTSSLLSTTTFANSYNCGPNCNGGALVGAVTSGNNATTQAGWALGGGAEYRLADAWSIKGEYLYTSLGGITRNDTSIGTGGTTAFTQTTTGTYNLHQILIGLNYHTGWLNTVPVVAAKY